MAGVGSGKTSQLEELYERHHGSIYRFLRRSGCRTSLAEDLTQEVFLRVLRYRSTFQRDSAFSPWLFKIARNLLLDHRMRRGIEVDSEPYFTRAPDPGASPERAAEAKLELSRLASGLSRLSLEQRHALLLARFHDLSYREIGAILDCTEGAVKARVYRALQNLSRELGEKESTP